MSRFRKDGISADRTHTGGGNVLKMQGVKILGIDSWIISAASVAACGGNMASVDARYLRDCRQADLFPPRLWVYTGHRG
jgi:hypothetical protein